MVLVGGGVGGGGGVLGMVGLWCGGWGKVNVLGFFKLLDELLYLWVFLLKGCGKEVVLRGCI